MLERKHEPINPKTVARFESSYNKAFQTIIDKTSKRDYQEVLKDVQAAAIFLEIVGNDIAVDFLQLGYNSIALRHRQNVLLKEQTK